MEHCPAILARFPDLTEGAACGIQYRADATLADPDTLRDLAWPEPFSYSGKSLSRTCEPVQGVTSPQRTCRADADDGEWSHLSAVLVHWIVGRPFRMENGEMYTGDWIYHPGTLANGGPDAVSCQD